MVLIYMYCFVYISIGWRLVMLVRLTLLVLTRFTRAEGNQLSFRADRSNYNASYRLGNTYLRNIKHIMLLGAPYTCTVVVVAKRTATLESKQCGGVFYVMYPLHLHQENLACLLF